MSCIQSKKIALEQSISAIDRSNNNNSTAEETMSESSECASPWASLLEADVSQNVPLIALGVLCSILVVSKLNDWHFFYQLKLIVEYLVLCPVPKIEVEMSNAEMKDDGIDSEPSAKTISLKDPKRPGFIQCFDPSTRQRLGEIRAMTEADVRDCCARAAAAQEAWSQTTYAQRRQVLRTIQSYIVRHVDDICRVCTRDSGKPKVDALLGEVLTTCEKIRCINANGELWLQNDYRPTGPVLMHKRTFRLYVFFPVRWHC